MPVLHHAIILINAGLLLTGPVGPNFSEIWILKKKIQTQEGKNWIENFIGKNLLLWKFIVKKNFSIIKMPYYQYD